MIVQVLAWLYGCGCFGLIVFQSALIAGAPWGPITQGGRHPGALPWPGRAMAAVSIGIIACQALAILSQAGIWPEWPRWTGWGAVLVSLGTAIANNITPSRPERRLWAVPTLILLGLAVAVMWLTRA